MVGGETVKIIRKKLFHYLRTPQVFKRYLFFSYLITNRTSIWRDCSRVKKVHCRCRLMPWLPLTNHVSLSKSSHPSRGWIVTSNPSPICRVTSSASLTTDVQHKWQFRVADYIECQVNSSSKTSQFYKDKPSHQGTNNDVRFHTPLSHY